MITKINCECNGNGYVNGWVSPDGDFDFERCDCNVCYFGLLLDEKAFATNPSTLCATHYQEWSDEKNFGDEY